MYPDCDTVNNMLYIFFSPNSFQRNSLKNTVFISLCFLLEFHALNSSAQLQLSFNDTVPNNGESGLRLASRYPDKILSVNI